MLLAHSCLPYKCTAQLMQRGTTPEQLLRIPTIRLLFASGRGYKTIGFRRYDTRCYPQELGRPLCRSLAMRGDVRRS